MVAPPSNDIEIRVRTAGQLFSSFDPSPFPKRDIDEDAERFIVDWARELPREAAFRIVVQLPAAQRTLPETSALPTALANYFSSRVQRFDAELRELFRIGWRSLLIGVAVLTASLVASQTLARMIPQPTVAGVVEESLILVGWSPIGDRSRSIFTIGGRSSGAAGSISDSRKLR